jgi:hypothetical protein
MMELLDSPYTEVQPKRYLRLPSRRAKKPPELVSYVLVRIVDVLYIPIKLEVMNVRVNSSLYL